MKISALQNLFDSHSCYRGITNSTTRFGPTKMNSMQLLRHRPLVLDSPAYLTADDLGQEEQYQE